MKRWIGVLCAATLCLGSAHPAFSKNNAPSAAKSPSSAFTGSADCRSCHEKFYQLWSTSFHGLAMRPYSEAFAASFLTPQPQPLTIGEAAYRVELGPGQGVMVETVGGTVTRYPMVQALGGKNVFYFLTPLDQGRLQTLPLAYDVRKKEWFDMAASGVRHAPAGATPAVHWKDWPYTFNTACHGCHVSQFATNYDPASGAYHSTWTEPGINCETCHGPGQEHVRVCEAAPKDRPPKDLKLIRGGRDFSHAQQNDLCAVCHAKAVPLTASFAPGDRFFDHYDLVTYENPDFYPDGRDLGENYTQTSWARSPCALSGQLDCMHCHTSSGRYKFADPAKANEACNPCHAKRVAEASAHTHHPEGSPGNRCVSCHMPMTEFARMRRSDHSMLPPTPAATLVYGSPNACNLCHGDKDAAWADGQVRQWRARDYQALVLRQAALVDAARRRDWSTLPAMLEYLGAKDPDAVVAASLLRLLGPCPDARKWGPILAAAGSPSPLVRAAAVEALADMPSRQALDVLLGAVSDDYRLVRVRAAAALAGAPKELVPPAVAPALEKAAAEYLASLTARPDLWTSQYNLGNYYLSRGEAERAVSHYEKACRLDPAAAAPLVNLSLAHSRLGELDKAEADLRQALALAPDDAPAHFNLGLLLAERGDAAGAQAGLRAALEHAPDMAEAAYNLGLLLGQSNPREATALCRKAYGLRPDNPRYAYALAVLLHQDRQDREALAVLGPVVAAQPGFREAALLYAKLVSTTR